MKRPESHNPIPVPGCPCVEVEAVGRFKDGEIYRFSLEKLTELFGLFAL